ncbi:MAG: hypothetical protein HY903_17150 [Deltaproteobacteria bacterium]|nr:hypothetical protein [Deltaproteobacteria bacterium]
MKAFLQFWEDRVIGNMNDESWQDWFGESRQEWFGKNDELHARIAAGDDAALLILVARDPRTLAHGAVIGRILQAHYALLAAKERQPRWFEEGDYLGEKKKRVADATTFLNRLAEAITRAVPRGKGKVAWSRRMVQRCFASIAKGVLGIAADPMVAGRSWDELQEVAADRKAVRALARSHEVHPTVVKSFLNGTGNDVQRVALEQTAEELGIPEATVETYTRGIVSELKKRRK